MLLSNFTIYLVMKYGRTIQKFLIFKNHDHAYLKFINIFQDMAILVWAKVI